MEVAKPSNVIKKKSPAGGKLNQVPAKPKIVKKISNVDDLL